MDASTVLKMATIKGAKALGLDQVIGSLETGKKADLIIIDPNKPHLTPMYNPVSHLVYAAMGSDVTTSIINGTVVMEDGQIKTMDIKAVMDDVNRIAWEIAAG
jgi:5-methylthioadenosine/S-adenosylhomocysteine deaminase